jgi:hypothetical protein
LRRHIRGPDRSRVGPHCLIQLNRSLLSLMLEVKIAAKHDRQRDNRGDGNHDDLLLMLQRPGVGLGGGGGKLILLKLMTFGTAQWVVLTIWNVDHLV